jgi:branched-chain amino acid transport system substrate-binding protein
MRTFKSLALLAAATFGLAAGAYAQTQGVTDNEIVVGTVQDLSGPLAAYGKQARLGMQMRADEINAAGGINGRKIKFLAEDSAYDPRKAQLAAQKMVQQDKIFAMIGSIGTAPVMAMMPLLLERNVLSLWPLTGARETYEPLHKLKYSLTESYYTQVKTALPVLIKQKGYKSVGVLYQDDEFGLEVLRGAEAALKDLGMPVVEKTSYKRGSTDFSSQIAKLQAANVDIIVLGTLVRETVGAIAEARKNGWNNVAFLGTTGLYTDLIHKLGGKATDGLYGVSISSIPYADDESKEVRDWAASYKARFNEDPAVFSTYGYYYMDAFVQAAQKAGRNLTVDSYVAALENLSIPTSIFGSPPLKFSKTDHLGLHGMRISQIQNGRWVVVVKDYIFPAPEK